MFATNRINARISGVLAAVVGVGALVAGCGGENTISKATFITRADQACAALNAKGARLPEAPPPVSDPPEADKIDISVVAPYLAQELPIISGVPAELRSLPKPDQDSRALRDVLAKSDALIAILKTAQSDAAKGDVAAYHAAAAKAPAAAQAARAAGSAWGFKVCYST